MPAQRSSRRAHGAKIQHHFSDDEDEDLSPTGTDPAYNPFPMPPPSSLPRSSHARKKPPNHIRRPRNAFIIFRSDFCAKQKMKESGIECDHRHISRIAAHVWNNLAEDKKEAYQTRALLESAAHKLAYPDYHYTPVGRSKIVKPKRKRDSAEDDVRSRQLSELLISGVEGEAFRQAAKALDEGVIQVELTPRTSCRAPKRSKRDHRRIPRLLPVSPSSDGLTNSPEAENIPGNCNDLALSFPPHWESEPTRADTSFLETLPPLPFHALRHEAITPPWSTPSASTIGFPAFPTLSDTPPPQSPSSVASVDEIDTPLECSPFSVPFSLDSPWKLGANPEVSFVQADGLSLCCPNDAEFGDYLAGF